MNDLVLDSEEVGQIAIVMFRPEMATAAVAISTPTVWLLSPEMAWVITVTVTRTPT